MLTLLLLVSDAALKIGLSWLFSAIATDVLAVLSSVLWLKLGCSDIGVLSSISCLLISSCSDDALFFGAIFFTGPFCVPDYRLVHIWSLKHRTISSAGNTPAAKVLVRLLL